MSNKKEKRRELAIIKDSFPKVAPRCPYFGKCGGCFMQDVAYENQLKSKREYLEKLFSEAHIESIIPLPQGSPDLWYYRNRMDYPVGEHGEVGLKPMGMWRDVLDLKSCFLLSPIGVEIMEVVRQWMKHWKLEGWNAVRHKGYIRYVVIREGKNTNERMITLVTAPNAKSIIDPLPYDDIWNDAVTRLAPLCASLYRGINTRVTDVSEPDELIHLHGDNYLHEVVNGFEFLISPFSFFQTNTKAAEILQKYILDLVCHPERSAAESKDPPHRHYQSSRDPSASPQDDIRVLDLYCGAGFFTLPLAKAEVNVVGVELVEEAIKMARENATRNNLDVEFHAVKAEDHIRSLKRGMYDTIIIDPPRAGLHPKVITKLVEIGVPEIIYVSCNPAKLVEELPEFLKKYSIDSLNAFDMFPHTPHVEVVIKLVLR